ncbi:hypothetical protein C4D60_Mb08t26430 [Musa balbisiana]|uniref:Cell wall hydroxyproline-rich glycoprotein n=1 Tax=Musa balbisiana TaxID=52838 RepID=A0A4V4H975_MUSBA|nr:hypothetical protein C4D60_Mb08t26430 [Musa balbisiana]
MKKHGRASPFSFLLLLSSLLLPLASSCSGSHGHIRRLRQLLHDGHDADDSAFPNPHLRDAYIALQAWKLAIISDPLNLTGNWVGPGVCNYTGVFCSPLPSDPNLTVVAGVDLNHGDLAGYLPHQLGLLADLALLHINSNRFCGTLPRSLRRLALLHELDVSNNRLAGPFPDVVLRLPSLRYLDLRFNEFEGAVPPELFDRDLDAIFINHNRFAFDIPENLGNSPVSVVAEAALGPPMSVLPVSSSRRLLHFWLQALRTGTPPAAFSATSSTFSATAVTSSAFSTTAVTSSAFSATAVTSSAFSATAVTSSAFSTTAVTSSAFSATSATSSAISSTASSFSTTDTLLCPIAIATAAASLLPTISIATRLLRTISITTNLL